MRLETLFLARLRYPEEWGVAELVWEASLPE